MDNSKEVMSNKKEVLEKYAPIMSAYPNLTFVYFLMKTRQIRLEDSHAQVEEVFARYKERVLLYFIPNNKRKRMGLPMRRGIVNRKAKD